MRTGRFRRYPVLITIEFQLLIIEIVDSVMVRLILLYFFYAKSSFYGNLEFFPSASHHFRVTSEDHHLKVKN